MKINTLNQVGQFEAGHPPSFVQEAAICPARRPSSSVWPSHLVAYGRAASSSDYALLRVGSVGGPFATVFGINRLPLQDRWKMRRHQRTGPCSPRSGLRFGTVDFCCSRPPLPNRRAVRPVRDGQRGAGDAPIPDRKNRRSAGRRTGPLFATVGLTRPLTVANRSNRRTATLTHTWQAR